MSRQLPLRGVHLHSGASLFHTNNPRGYLKETSSWIYSATFYFFLYFLGFYKIPPLAFSQGLYKVCILQWRLFSDYNCEVSKEPVHLISGTHSPIYFPLKSYFYEFRDCGANRAGAGECALFFYVCFFFSPILFFGFSSSPSDITYRTAHV